MAEYKWQREDRERLEAMAIDQLFDDGTLADYVDPDDYDGEHTSRQWWRRELWRRLVRDRIRSLATLRAQNAALVEALGALYAYMQDAHYEHDLLACHFDPQEVDADIRRARAALAQAKGQDNG